MSDLHDPDPEFLAHLEWQTRTSIRRATRFAAEPARPPAGNLMRQLRIAALALFCVLCGGGAVLAAQELEEHRNKGELLAHNALRLQLELTRREGVDEALARIRAGLEAGIVGPGALEQSQLQRAALDLAIRRLELERDEIEASGLEPNGRLDAPLVGDVDFVAARLKAELVHALEVHGLTQPAYDRLRALFENGRVSSRELSAVATRVETASGELELLKDLLRLRLTYRAQDLSAEECRLLEQLIRVRHELQSAAKQLKHMRKTREENDVRVAAGIQGPGVWPTPQDLQAAEIEVELLRGFAETLRKRLGEEVELRPLPAEFKKLLPDRR